MKLTDFYSPREILDMLYLAPINERYVKENEYSFPAVGDIKIIFRLKFDDRTKEELELDEGVYLSGRAMAPFVDKFIESSRLTYDVNVNYWPEGETRNVRFDIKNVDNLRFYAAENTLKLFGNPHLVTLPPVDEPKPIDLIVDKSPEEMPSMLCVSFKEPYFGAIVAFIPGVLKALAKAYNDDLIISFTSVHEVMVHPKKMLSESGLTINDIKESLIYVNTSCDIYDEEQLSNKVYFYDREKDVLLDAG